MFRSVRMFVLMFVCIVIAFLHSSVQAQFPIGHQTKSFTDPSRNNRSIPSEIYYPAETIGNNTPLAEGAFPVIVFGHGFLMPYSAYAYFKDAIVPEGYIVVFPKTEGSILPSHLNFGLDLAFLVEAMQAEDIDPASPFYQHIDTTSAIMGHSMGGGASFLACQNNTTPTVMVTFAAAETTPSAIAAAAQVTIPTLVFAASEDCVTPPASNQIPMYNALASDCKVYINITGGGHCYFADYNFQCSLGEASCQQNFTITREEQQATTLDFTKLYLDYFLKKNPNAWNLFQDSLNNSNRITNLQSCILTGVKSPASGSLIKIQPNPASNSVQLNLPLKIGENAELLLTNPEGVVYRYGKIQFQGVPLNIDATSLPTGVFFLSVYSREGIFHGKLIKE